MASDGADGDSMSLATGDLVVNVADVLALPGGVASVTDDDVGGFDVPPLRSGMLRERPT